MDQAFYKRVGAEGGRKSSQQLWISTETGFVSMAAGVCRHNIKRGFSPDARKRWFPPEPDLQVQASFDGADKV